MRFFSLDFHNIMRLRIRKPLPQTSKKRYNFSQNCIFILNIVTKINWIFRTRIGDSILITISAIHCCYSVKWNIKSVSQEKPNKKCHRLEAWTSLGTKLGCFNHPFMHWSTTHWASLINFVQLFRQNSLFTIIFGS